MMWISTGCSANISIRRGIRQSQRFPEPRLAAVAHNEESFPYATTKFAIGLYLGSFQAVFLLCITVASIVFGNEYTNHTLKNSISYGINRSSIYFGKLIVEILYAFIAFAIITGIDIGSAYLLL